MDINSKIIGVAILSMSAQLSVADGSIVEHSDVVGQGAMGPLVSQEGATLMRSENGLNIKLAMPTPEPGSYVYPSPNPFQPEVLVGAPEAFTGWAFIFNYPEECTDPCSFDDLGPQSPAKGGAYNFAGHVVGGRMIRLSGRVSVGDTPFFAAPGAPLENPMGAEVHIAVAPHGQLIPELLPVQITYPVGTPDHWWVAEF